MAPSTPPTVSSLRETSINDAWSISSALAADPTAGSPMRSKGVSIAAAQGYLTADFMAPRVTTAVPPMIPSTVTPAGAMSATAAATVAGGALITPALASTPATAPALAATPATAPAPEAAPVITTAEVAAPVITPSEVAAPVITPADTAALGIAPAPVAAVVVKSAPVAAVGMKSAPLAAVAAAPASLASVALTPAPVAAQVLTGAVAAVPVMTPAQVAAPHVTPNLVPVQVVASTMVVAPVVTPAPVSTSMCTPVPVEAPVISPAPVSGLVVMPAAVTVPAMAPFLAAAPVVTSAPMAAPVGMPAPVAAPVVTPAPVAAPVVTPALVAGPAAPSAAAAAALRTPAAVTATVVTPAAVTALVVTTAAVAAASTPFVTPAAVAAAGETAAAVTAPDVPPAAVAAASTPFVTPAAVAETVGTHTAVTAPVVLPAAVAAVSTLAALAPWLGEAATVTRVNGPTTSGRHSVIKITAAAPSINTGALVTPGVVTSADATPIVTTATVAAAALPVSALAVAPPSVVSPSAVASAMTESIGSGGASGTGATAVGSTAARGTAAFEALKEASGAAARARGRAVNDNRTVVMQRLWRYITAVNGCSAPTKALEDAAAMVASASALEDGNDNVQVVIRLSGVSATGDLSWASLFGQGAYVDPDVLRVFGQAHQFFRGRDVLSRARLSADSEARLVGTLHRGQAAVPTSSSPPPISSTAEDEEILDSFTSRADSILPPHVSIQRLARMVARAHSASRSSSPLDDVPPGRSSAGSAVHSSTVSDGGAASGGDSVGAPLAGVGIPFVLESMTLPPPVTPIKSAVDFMTDLFLNRRAPVQLLRATLKAVIMICAMHFGLSPRQIMECSSRWWVDRIVARQAEDGAVVAPRWPMGVKVPSRFLSPRFFKAASKASKVLPREEPLRAGADMAAGDVSCARLSEESVIIYLDATPSTECHCKHEEAVAVLLLLWTKEPWCRSAMQHEVFKADHAALRRKAAPKRKSPDGTCAKALRDGAPDLAPRQVVDTGRVGRASTVSTTRAAARAAARGATPSAAPVLHVEVLPAPAGRVEGAPAVPEAETEEPEVVSEGEEDGPLTSSPAKRSRQVE